MTPEEKERELQKQQEALTRGQELFNQYNDAAEKMRQLGEQQVNDINGATRQFIDTSTADQKAYRDEMTGYRTKWQSDMDAGMGGVEAIIKEGEARLQREREIAQAEYLASQKAASVSGLTHLATSLGNLIGVGFFNAPHSNYENPSIDWMRKADQDKQIARQRMDNLRDRQRQLQQHQLELKMNIANQAYGMDSALAGQDLEFRRGIANVGYQTAKDVAGIRSQAEMQAIEAGLQGTTAKVNADLQDAQMAQNERHFNAQMAAQDKHYRDQTNAQLARSGYQLDEDGNIVPIINPVTGQPVGPVSSRSGSGSGGSTSGNNYPVTVDGQKIVLGMNTETYNSAIQSGKKAIQQDVMDAAGFKGTWDEFVEAASSDKIKNPEGRGKIANPLNAYSDIIAALNYNGRDQDEAKSMNAILEDYVARNSDATNNFNKHLVDVSNRQRDAAYVPQSTEQAAAVAATTPSQQRRAPEQPTRVETRNGKLVTVDSVTGEVLHEGADTAAQPQLNWEDKVQWK